MVIEVIFVLSVQDINIIVVIDMEWVKKMYLNLSQDLNKLMGIVYNGQFLICIGVCGVKGQGMVDLEIIVYLGDCVQFIGVLIYDNFDDVVIIYNILCY